MVHDDPIEVIQRSRARSMRLIVEMFADMAALVANVSIARYMMACFNYRVRDVIIGSHPYPDHIVPCLGSAYSQQDRTCSTPTTDYTQTLTTAFLSFFPVILSQISHWSFSETHTDPCWMPPRFPDSKYSSSLLDDNP